MSGCAGLSGESLRRPRSAEESRTGSFQSVCVLCWVCRPVSVMIPRSMGMSSQANKLPGVRSLHQSSRPKHRPMERGFFSSELATIARVNRISRGEVISAISDLAAPGVLTASQGRR